MSNKKENLERLKKLCDELSDRDQQLKINASALWDMIDAVNSAKEHLSDSSLCSCVDSDKIKEGIEKLNKALLIIDAKGCKKVQNGH